MKKKITSILLLYFFQFIIASCCNCSDETDAIKYTGFKLSTWNTSVIENAEISNATSKNSFAISIYIESEIKTIVDIFPKLNMSNFGFTSAYAISCECYVGLEQADPIVDIEISVIDTQTQKLKIITNNFEPNGYENFEEMLSSDIGYGHDQYQLDMTDSNNIPDFSIFIVKFILESGIELTEQTQKIQFE